jgi:hypothetical protein
MALQRSPKPLIGVRFPRPAPTINNFMLFIKKKSNSNFRLLYVMGSTWHTKCMFDLKSTEPSFCDLLVENDIETYAVDIIGSGPGSKPLMIGNRHQDTLKYLQQTIDQYQITHVMSYLNGSSLVVDLIKHNQFAGLIFFRSNRRNQSQATAGQQ